jgi:hypothetical protein
MEAFTAEHLVNALFNREAESAAQPLSLYVHIPFCNTICYYCACNKVVTKDHGRSASVGTRILLNTAILLVGAALHDFAAAFDTWAFSLAAGQQSLI